MRDGTYVCIEGPQFSTLAESLTYKNLGYAVIGMTNMPEAKLAREAEICYATVAMVTDFDCWHPDHDAVTVQDIIRVLGANADKAKRLVARLAQDFPRRHEPCPIGSDRALDTALITAPEARDPEVRRDALSSITTLPGWFTRAQLVDRYAQLTGRDVSGLGYYEVFGIFKIAVVLQQIYFRYWRGQTHDERFRGFGERVRGLVEVATGVAERAG